jgi:hypothetical protein
MGMSDQTVGGPLQQAQERLTESIKRLLEPGEQYQSVFYAQTGPNPRVALLIPLGPLFVHHRFVVVTDRNIVLCKCGKLGHEATAVLARLPREGPVGMAHEGVVWGKVMIGGKRYWAQPANVVAFNRDAFAAA